MSTTTRCQLKQKNWGYNKNYEFDTTIRSYHKGFRICWLQPPPSRPNPIQTQPANELLKQNG